MTKATNIKFSNLSYTAERGVFKKSWFNRCGDVHGCLNNLRRIFSDWETWVAVRQGQLRRYETTGCPYRVGKRVCLICKLHAWPMSGNKIKKKFGYARQHYWPLKWITTMNSKFDFKIVHDSMNISVWKLISESRLIHKLSVFRWNASAQVDFRWI